LGRHATSEVCNQQYTLHYSISGQIGPTSLRCYNVDLTSPGTGSEKLMGHVLGAEIMSLTPAEVAHIAVLAKLALTREEEDLYREQLSAILDYASVLQRIDTAAIPPTATVLPLRSVMREDLVEPSMSREDVLANAPDPFDGFFRVRAILEDGD